MARPPWKERTTNDYSNRRQQRQRQCPAEGGTTAVRPMSSWVTEHLIFQVLCPQFVIMLAVPGARGMFVRVLVSQ